MVCAGALLYCSGQPGAVQEGYYLTQSQWTQDLGKLCTVFSL